MAQLLNASGYAGVTDPDDASILIVNTCGFIGPAREESIRSLRELAEGKRRQQTLIAAGCLSQIWGPKLVEEVPGIDGVIGTRRWMDIVEFTDQLRATKHPQPLYHLPEEAKVVGADPVGRDEKSEQRVLRVSQTGVSAYLKIADGCRRPCAFCSIPRIKGTAVSRPPEAIVREARVLADRGVRELILIAQDLTDYGHDLGLKDGLPTLLESICDSAPELKWIRLMYQYPGAVSDRLDRSDGDPTADRALRRYSVAARPSRSVEAHAPPGQHRVGVSHLREDSRGHARCGDPHDVHRRLSRRDGRRVRRAVEVRAGLAVRSGGGVPVFVRAGHAIRRTRRPTSPTK